MIWSLSFTSKRHNKVRQCWERQHWRIHMLFLIIPLWIDNWKTEYIYANGKLVEE